jgi:TonB-linked SusC/RagA family outer membrane protein
MKKNFTKLSVLTFLCVLFFHAAFAQNITVTGVVTDAGDKTTIPSVSIIVKGTTVGTQSDANGRYSISVPANGTLTFTYIGYTAQDVPVNNRASINVVLASNSRQLEQVVVVGYGTQRKIDVTGAVSSVKGEDISKQISPNPVSALQGRVAGVAITNNGAPGASPQITIRGTGTIYGNTNVLYVVDGVWYDDISFLNPADIANISILKDASSQSIYGIRAANGVVLVTTIRGKKGDATINYNGTAGIESVTNAVKMANATEYATAINELYNLVGSKPLFSNTNLGEGTDWYNQALRNAMITNHQLSINGGTDKSTYNFSLGYLNQEGLIENNNYKRYTSRLSSEFQVFEPLKIGYNVTGTYSKSNDAPAAIFHDLFAASPVVPVFNADGSYGDPADFNLGNGSNMNPQATLDFNNHFTSTYRLTGNIYAELKFLKHLTFRTSLGGDFGQLEVRSYIPKYEATVAQRATISTLGVDRTETRNWIIENTLTYDNKWADHNLTFLLGQTAQRYRGYVVNAAAQNVPFSSEGDLYLSLGDIDKRTIKDSGTLRTAASYFARANYSYKSKYLVNASIRADGASQFFGGSDLWGYFPSIGAGWVISNEDFMKDQTIVSNMKLRASWGKIGNAGVPINPTTSTVAQTPNYTAYFNHVAYTGANVNSIVPPAIFWERSAGTDIGLEMGFLTNRLSVELDYYNKKTEQAIFDIPILGSLGTSTSKLIGNQADFRNRGFEVSATWSDKTDGGLTYSFSGNVGINNNKVLNVTSGANPIYAGGAGLTSGALSTRTVQGGPIGAFFGYQVAGIFQTNEEASASGQSGTTAGDFRYVDQNGDGLIDGKDRIVLGNPNPKYTFGVNSNFGYKNFDLSVDIQGVAGVDIYNANLGYRFGNENFTKEFYQNRWTGPGSTNTYPSPKLGGSTNYYPNSFYVESGSYIRLRNIQLGYSLPKAMISKWKMRNLRVFANAQNALNFFGYRGFSPEVGGTPTNAGIDVNVYPLFATYNLGVNLTF